MKIYFSPKIISQRLYEIAGFIFAIVLCTGVKKEVSFVMPLVSVTFCYTFIFRDPKLNRISFAIYFAVIGLIFWALVITDYLTNYLWTRHYIADEHSPWDVFAVFVPIILGALTF